MGGIGSGRRPGTQAGSGGRRRRQTTDQLPGLDVRALKRDGLIAPGQERVAIRLRFRRRLEGPGAEWKELVARVGLTWTVCNYGGAGRPWFVCPGCERRAAILYGTKSPLLCRLCLGLAYASQQEARRSAPVVAKLG